jgi:hypothetical protein
MTMTWLTPVRAIQLLGLAGSAIALLLAPFEGGYGFILFASAAIATLLDLFAAFRRPTSMTLLSGLLKPVVAFFPALLLVGGAAVAPPPVDPNVGWGILMWSSAPTIGGALIGRLSR